MRWTRGEFAPMRTRSARTSAGQTAKEVAQRASLSSVQRRGHKTFPALLFFWIPAFGWLKKRKDSFLFVGVSPQKHTPVLFRSFSVRTLLARCDPAGTIPSYPLLTKQQALNAHQALPSRSVSAQKCCSPVAPVWGLFSLLRWQ